MSLAAGAALVAAFLAGAGRDAAIALCLAQTAGVLWLVFLGADGPRAWVTSAFVVGAAWIPLFLVPCWVYSLHPELLTTTRAPEQPIAITTVSLFALIAGLLVFRLARSVSQPGPLVIVQPGRVSMRAVGLWSAFAVGCLGVLMAANGGPIAYVTNFDKSGQLNRGLLYLIWAVLFLRFAPVSAIAGRWAAGRKAGVGLILTFVAGSLSIAVTGSRWLLAVAGLQFLFVWALMRGGIRLRDLIVPVVILSFLLVFGLGSLKRFQAYQQTHPGTSITFRSYLVQVAPHDAVRAYVGNYFDGVALIGAARRIVPAHANYEYGKAFLRLAAKPIPRPFRPALDEAPAVRRELNPPGGYVFAIPLQAIAYLQFGVPGVLVAFVLVGGLIASVDSRLASSKELRLPLFLGLVTLAIQIPQLLRSGIPAGAVFLLIDVIGTWIAAMTVTGTTRVERNAIGRRLRRG